MRCLGKVWDLLSRSLARRLQPVLLRATCMLPIAVASRAAIGRIARCRGGVSAAREVASPHSSLDASTFTEAELRAAVEAAENWGTYVTVHAYTPASIQRAIAAGGHVHRTWALDGRGERQAHRGAWHLAQYPAVSRGDGER